MIAHFLDQASTYFSATVVSAMTGKKRTSQESSKQRYLIEMSSNWKEEIRSTKTASTPTESESDSDQSEFDWQSSTQNMDSIFMNDDVRRIDFVLVGHLLEKHVNEATKRLKFERCLRREGLELENYIDVENMLRFVKIHAPWNTLTKYAELLRYDMPVGVMRNNVTKTTAEKVCRRWNLPPIKKYYTAPYLRDNERCFLIKDEDSFFSAAQRSNIVNHILKGAEFTNNNKIDTSASSKVGLDRLLKQNVYIAGYPLHSGEVDEKNKADVIDLPRDLEEEGSDCNLRRLLYLSWGRLRRVLSDQPLDHIRLYSGENVGFFFAFARLYIKMLVPLAILGCTVIAYGILRLLLNSDASVYDVCDPLGAGDTTMCPVCEECTLWTLKESCLQSTLVYLIIDNELGTIYTLIFPMWCVLFVEMWKRQRASLMHSWHLHNRLVTERIRLQFLEHATTTTVNPGTGIVEPAIPRGKKRKRRLGSMLFMLLSVGVALSGVSIVSWYGGVSKELLHTHIRKNFTVFKNGTLVDTCVAVNDETGDFILLSGLHYVSSSLANAVVVLVLELAFKPLAKYVTDYEIHKTESEWQYSYAMKLFFFLFFSKSIYIYYVAFFEETPYYEGLGITRSVGIFIEKGGLGEICKLTGAIIIVDNITAIIFRYGRIKILHFLIFKKISSEDTPLQTNCKLRDVPRNFIANDYIYHLVNFGMLAFFSAAIPFGALFVLITTMIATRLTAYELLVLRKKSVDDGFYFHFDFWLNVMKILTYIGTVSNACLIAFKSENIKREFYRYMESEDQTLEGYYEFSLSSKNISACDIKKSNSIYLNENTCMFRDFLHTERHTGPHTDCVYWKCLAIQLAFVITYVAIVQSVSPLLHFLIPEEGSNTMIQRMRERQVAKVILHAHKASTSTYMR